MGSQQTRLTSWEQDCVVPGVGGAASRTSSLLAQASEWLLSPRLAGPITEAKIRNHTSEILIWIPATTVPVGFRATSNMPVGLDIIGLPLSDQSLLNIAYGVEQLVQGRQTPKIQTKLQTLGSGLQLET
ncbi:hypothetical protein F5Y16DRAFT_77359 [Xylariaceae sp. FL0255]|nr:hypothetical protein F5Y16DRAFT_77359 [Xylariaceae sp. FL0255]